MEKVNFKELKCLYLEYNNIKDINVLEKIHFDKLEVLWIHENKIDIYNNALIISYLDNKVKNFTYLNQHP